MVEFLYHGDAGGESPFGEKIAQLARDGGISIACPFLDVEILESLADASDQFRVLTDFEAWFSVETNHEGSELRSFIEEFAGSVRDLPGLHAKLVLGQEEAYLGSANLTRSGLAKNRELGVAITEAERVRELRDWFDFVWGLGTPRSADELDAIFESTRAARNTTRRRPESDSRRAGGGARAPVNASLTTLFDSGRSDVEAEPGEFDDDARERLVKRLSNTPGRWWAERYFELVSRLLEATGLESGDPRLAATIPKSYERLCVSINNRYVLTGMWQGDSDFGFMVGPDFELPPESEHTVVYPGYGYTPNSQESEDTVPRFFAFEITEETEIPTALIENWVHYMNLEKEYRSGSMFQQYHEPIVCSVARNETLRDKVLAAAFQR